jgi:hypothetical protein
MARPPLRPPFRAFQLDRGHYRRIDVPGSISTLPLGQNDRGQVVGPYDDADNRRHGFLLDRGRYTTIDAPGAAPSTATTSINDRGQIVGVRDLAPATASVRDRAMLPAQNSPYVRMTSNW